MVVAGSGNGFSSDIPSTNDPVILTIRLDTDPEAAEASPSALHLPAFSILGLK